MAGLNTPLKDQKIQSLEIFTDLKNLKVLCKTG